MQQPKEQRRTTQLAVGVPSAGPCRLCSSDCSGNGSWDLFGSELPGKIMALAVVKIRENDGLPAIVCTNCRDMVHVTYAFKCQVEKSDRDLRRALTDKQPTPWPADPISSSREEAAIPYLQSNDIFSPGLPIPDDYAPFEATSEPERNTDDSISAEQSARDAGTIGSAAEINNGNESDDEKPLILRTKRHKCNYCIKSFADLAQLDKHAKVHKQQKIYVCHVCDEQFDAIEKIKSHAVKVHERKEAKRYTCKFCSRIFTCHRLYVSHNRCHKNKQLSPPAAEGAAHPKTTGRLPSIHASYFTNSEAALNPSDLKTPSYPVNAQIGNSKTPNFPRGYNLALKPKSSDCDNDDDTDSEDSEDSEDSRDEDSGALGGAVQCNQCGKLVATRRNLKRHLLTHSGLRYTCSACDKDFSRQDKLREHQQSKHGQVFGKSRDNELPPDGKNNFAARKRMMKRVRPYQCPICPKAFAQPQSLANHEERHNRVREVQRRQFLCEVCSKVFAQSGSLVAHMRTHTGVKPYVCNICSRAFTKSTYLQLHLRTHSGEKPYVCQYCSKTFARANTLARHITMHTGEAKYQCQICSKLFRRLTSLNEHVYTHTGQRPYACKTCGKRYNNAGSLYAHAKKCKSAVEAKKDANLAPDERAFVDNQVSIGGAVGVPDCATMMQPIEDVDELPSQILIFADKKQLDDAISDEVLLADAQTCQFMIANGDGSMLTNVLDQLTVQDSDIFNPNSRQLKMPFYGLFPTV
ncbi:zinc finger protein 569-like [Copidosoma floridanum]|uniref:zinc finger protein 569-like n=1 Tax=Copidosoma floridanum TaxID=29053 RepID=UPI0006C9B935|nr:zinc finger protein 569-like [Copidosoma floridanum]